MDCRTEDVYDTTFNLFALHNYYCFLRKDEGSTSVDCKNSVPKVDCGIFESSPGGDASSVDKSVDAAKSCIAGLYYLSAISLSA